MALNDSSQLSKAFKTLINKEFTTPSRGSSNEFGASTINLNSQELWTSPLSTTASVAVAAGSASLYTQFVLTPDTSFPTNVFYFASGSGFTPGVDSITGNRDKIQRNFISDKYGSSYTALLYDNSNTLIPPADNIDWFFDYVTGILYIQDPGEGSYNTPYKITVYQYKGDVLTQTLSDVDSEITAVSSSLNDLSGSLSSLSQDKLTLQTVTASLGTGEISFAITSASLNLFTVNNSGSVYSTSFTSSFTGSYEGDGSSLTNIPASAIIGLNLSQIATGSVTASVSDDSDVFKITSASIDLLTVNQEGNNTNINTATTITGSSLLSASAALTITSSEPLDFRYGLMVSQSAWAFNHNVGYPTSYPWKSGLEGSYFYNFTANSDISEILRFMAGVISSSIDVATPVTNSRVYDGIDGTESSNSTTSRPSGYIPANYTNAAITYLVSKGFGAVAGQLFPTQTILASSGYNVRYTSRKTSNSTPVSGSNNGYNLGEKTLNYSVSASREWKFYDSNTISPGTLTFNTVQQTVLTNTTPDSTVSSLTRTTIQSAKPGVIPTFYQDGFFSSILQMNLSGTVSDFTSTSSVGWYEFTASIGSASGSGTPYDYNFSPSNSTRKYRVFWAPVSQINTLIGSNTLAGTMVVPTLTSATSRSLSGAPYLVSAGWTTNFTASGMFDPMYHNGTVASITLTGTNLSQTGVTSGSTDPNIATANAFYDASGNVRGTGAAPNVDDTVRLNTNVSFTALSNQTNLVSKSSITPASFIITGSAVDRNGTTSIAASRTVEYHAGGTAGQPAASGSLAMYGRGVGTDPSSTTFGIGSYGTEYFVEENYRKVIDNNALTFTLTSWNRDSILGNADLQVVPTSGSTNNGRLVDPGSSAGYWYAPNYGSTTKFYMRSFQYTSVSDAGGINIDLGTIINGSFNKWSDTASDGFAVMVLLEAQKSSGGSNAKFLAFEPTPAASSTATGVTTGILNPFTSGIDIVYTPANVVSGNEYRATFTLAFGQSLVQNQNVMVVVRMINTANAARSISQLRVKS